MKLTLPRPRVTVPLLAALAGAGLLFLGRSQAQPEAGRPDPAAVERTREKVKMMDDLHKGYVVHITDTYVKAQELTPAARVAKKVFRHMEEKGWGRGRLIDVTGKPLNEANVAKSAFEKRAAEQIRKGKPYLDEVGSDDGKPVLRAATVVPVVMKQCLTCHDGFKEGDPLGALVYELPIK